MQKNGECGQSTDFETDQETSTNGQSMWKIINTIGKEIQISSYLQTAHFTIIEDILRLTRLMYTIFPFPQPREQRCPQGLETTLHV